jgi:hypothetical protein
MAQKYYKATLENGVSQNTPTITYKVGKVVHPNPDRESKESCGRGIHLAKFIRAAREFVPKAREFYIAKPGAILGEDDKKVRCDSCRIIRRLSDDEVKYLSEQELTTEEKHRKELEVEAEMRKLYGTVYNTGGLPGKNWFQKHCTDITMEDINNQTLEIHRDGKKVMALKPTMKRADVRFAIKTALTEGI